MRALADASIGAGLAGTGWRLDPDGLEHAATGYFIEAGALGARRADGHWEWPLHMADKAWCAPRDFREAFLAALAAFGLSPDPGLAASFALARGGREGRIAQAAQDRFVHLGDPLGEVCPWARPVRAAGRRQPERARAPTAPAGEPAAQAGESARRAAARA